MPDALTPGQRCYEAFCMAYDDPCWGEPWNDLPSYRQRIWDAVAAAVLQSQEEPSDA